MTERMWPEQIVTAEGSAVDGGGAMCLSCGNAMQDHDCPEPVSTIPEVKRAWGNIRLLSSTNGIEEVVD